MDDDFEFEQGASYGGFDLGFGYFLPSEGEAEIFSEPYDHNFELVKMALEIGDFEMAKAFADDFGIDLEEVDF